MRPVALPDLVLDEEIRRRLVGNAQQRLRQHHQRDALGRGQREFMQQVFDAAQTRPRPNGADQAPGTRVDARLGVGRQHRRSHELRRERAVVAAPWRPEGSVGLVACWIALRHAPPPAP
jgi:hypothetical protein